MIYLRRKSEMRRPPLVGARLFLVADRPLVAAAEVEARGAVAYRPAAGPVRVTLDGEAFVLGRLFAAAGGVAAPVAGQVATEVAADQHGVVRRRVIVDRPQLLLAQRRARRVDLESESLGGQIASSAVQQAHPPLKCASAAAVRLTVHFTIAAVPVPVHRHLGAGFERTLVICRPNRAE